MSLAALIDMLFLHPILNDPDYNEESSNHCEYGATILL